MHLVQWELTQKRRSTLELSTYEAYKTIDQIVAFRAGELVITGSERADVCQLIDYARRRGLNPALAVSKTSQLSDAAIEKLRNNGLSRLVLRVDTAGDAVDLYRDMALEASTLVSRLNASQLADIANRLDVIGVRRWNVYFLVPIGDAKRLPALTADEVEVTLEAIEEIASRSSFPVRVFEAPHYCRYSAFADRTEVVFISHTGEVSISPFLPMSFGNVRYQPLSYLYGKAELFLALRNPDNLKGKCGRCEFKHLCGGSRARAFAVTGDIFAADPLCSYQPGAFRHAEP